MPNLHPVALRYTPTPAYSTVQHPFAPLFPGSLRLSLSTRTYRTALLQVRASVLFRDTISYRQYKAQVQVEYVPDTSTQDRAWLWLATTHTSHGFTCPWLVSWWSYILPGFPPVWFPFLPKQQQHHERNTKIRIRVSCHSPDHRASSAQACHTSPYLCQQLVLPALLTSAF